MSNVLIGSNEGLPNITGEIGIRGDFYSLEEQDLGALSSGIKLVGEDNPFLLKSENWNSRYIRFDAAASNPIYGRSQEVITKHLVVRYWKRTS